MISGLEVGLIQKRGVTEWGDGVVAVVGRQVKRGMTDPFFNDKCIVDIFWFQCWIHLATVLNSSIYIYTPYPLNSQSLSHP